MRYLTKSKFKLALECPTKLYYYDRKEYVNNKLENEFLINLAKGGFQVGELAKLYYPGGHDIDILDHDTSLAITNKLLDQENVIIYEAAFQFENLFIRADILIKNGNNLDLIEVKAKSYDQDMSFCNTSGYIVPKWSPYLYDIAFQAYVINKAKPNFVVNPFIMLADKSKFTSVEGLNQKFYLKEEKGRIKVEVIGNSSPEALGNEILTKVDVKTYIDLIVAGKDTKEGRKESFEHLVSNLSDIYGKDKRVFDKLGVQCKKCEYYTDGCFVKPELKSGFHECWAQLAGFEKKDFDKPSILDIWDFRQINKFLEKGRFFQEDITEDDIKVKASEESGLSRTERQLMQIRKSVANDSSYYFDKDGFSEEMRKWVFPLHFIDFETSAVAIPFNNNRRPYEQIAFQFSHHAVDAQGKIEHSGEWLNIEQGRFPNFDFVRSLKNELDKDKGTIFRYAAHENTILNAIYKQLLNSDEVDKEELCDWIKTITTSTGKSADSWQGERTMVDMLELVKRFYYHISMKGSNSIKDVLPATLNTSSFLKAKYSNPIYGRDIVSKNFNNYIWVTFDSNGSVENPYKKLPPIFQGFDGESLDELFEDEEAGISEGGAAMAAYAKMQFTQISTQEKELIEKALLRYCELDTFAMVMIWEAWNKWVGE